MLELKGVTVKFGHKIALNNISIKINEGEVVAIVGQNGAGKSSLIKELIGNSSLPVGYMPERATPDPYLTVDEFISYFIQLSNSNCRVEDIIELCNLQEYRSILCKNLSKGTSQRVILSAVLGLNTDIIILDEPTAGFDPLFQIEMNSIFSKIKGDKTIIISTHNISEIEHIASRIIVLKDGSINFDGAFNRTKSYYEYF
ncbi:MAG: ABC transporter ATP-binding protein [Spirochaetales bacterium]|nr:ABC transporter ATP-binding protein [Spirochaetales bacterium]